MEKPTLVDLRTGTKFNLGEYDGMISNASEQTLSVCFKYGYTLDIDAHTATLIYEGYRQDRSVLLIKRVIDKKKWIKKAIHELESDSYSEKDTENINKDIEEEKSGMNDDIREWTILTGQPKEALEIIIKKVKRRSNR